MLAVLEAFTDSYSGRDPVVAVYSKMEIAKWKDSLVRDRPHPVRSAYFSLSPTPTIPLQKSDERAPTMTINFVLLRSPLLSPYDPETIIVSREHGFMRGLSSILI